MPLTAKATKLVQVPEERHRGVVGVVGIRAAADEAVSEAEE